MRALQVENHGTKPVFSNISVPSVSSSQVLIQTEACGLNFADLLMIEGVYQETPLLPFSLGMEIAGDVVAVGQSVTEFKVGDRVAAFTGSGGLAEFCAVDIGRCIKISTNMSYETAASALISYGTSHLSLTHRAKIKSGDKLLVLGAGGGVGLTAVEIGAALGAEVIAVARGNDKMDICKTRGATITLDSAVDDVRSIIKKLGGIDIVYDPVGGSTAGFNMTWSGVVFVPRYDTEQELVGYEALQDVSYYANRSDCENNENRIFDTRAFSGGITVGPQGGWSYYVVPASESYAELPDCGCSGQVPDIFQYLCN